jgi:hypothetical protein
MFQDPMRCPACHRRMEASDTKEERHADPSGHGLYICRNPNCKRIDKELVIYRRVTSGMEARKLAVQDAAASTNNENLRLFTVQSERLNELTVWLRKNHLELLDGRFKDQVDAVLYLLKLEKRP